MGEITYWSCCAGLGEVRDGPHFITNCTPSTCRCAPPMRLGGSSRTWSTRRSDCMRPEIGTRDISPTRVLVKDQTITVGDVGSPSVLGNRYLNSQPAPRRYPVPCST